MDISKNIKDIREGKGLKQYEIADKLGIERQNYSRLEKRDKKLTIEQLESIAEALGVSLQDVLFGENRPIGNEFAYDQLKRGFLIDNVLKFILNIDNLLQQKTVNYTVGEIINEKQNNYQIFVRCHCNVGNEVFTLATWQKPINKESSLLANTGKTTKTETREVLFNDTQQKQASQIKDMAFASIQQNPDYWTINFINLTAFFDQKFKV